jgi:diacylglycerol kinase (ATP)
VRGLGASFRWAARGIVHSWVTGRNFRLQCLAGYLALVLARVLAVSRGEFAVLILFVCAVLAAEAFNTALERAVDLAGRRPDPLARTAKDAAAGAVLILALGSVAYAATVFAPALPALPGRWAQLWHTRQPEAVAYLLGLALLAAVTAGVRGRR